MFEIIKTIFVAGIKVALLHYDLQIVSFKFVPVTIEIDLKVILFEAKEKGVISSWTHYTTQKSMADK